MLRMITFNMMNRTKATLIILAASFWAVTLGLAQLDILKDAQSGDEQGPVQFESLETSYDQQLGIVRAKGDVIISYTDAIIYADQAEYHQNSGDIFARGDVSIFKSGTVFRGEEAVYNINTGVIIASDLEGGMDPIYYTTEEVTLQADDTDVIRTQNTYITTHDVENPNYRVKAKKLTIYPNEYIVFHSATVFVGKVPVMYFPFYAQPLDDELGFYFTPGYNDNWGGYILTQYGFLLGDHTLAKARLDYRSQRGLAGGIDLESLRFKDNDNFGDVKFYYAQDRNPNLNSSGEDRFTEASEERYRLDVHHRVYIPGPEESSLYLDIDINKRSDEFVDEDFFQSDFRENPRPDNLVNLVKTHPRGTVSLLGRFQINDFFRSDTRLPEIAADFTRAPIFNTNLFYEGNTSYSIMEEKLGDGERNYSRDRLQLAQDRLDLIESGEIDADTASFDPAAEADLITELNAFLDERSFQRFHTYHQLLYPTQVGFFSVVPRAGFGYTRYDEVMGNGSTIDSFDRRIVHWGMDASFKLHKDYNIVKPGIGLDQVRHVLQPFVKYSQVTTNDAPENFPSIDRLALSTNLRPVDLPLFTSVDDINTWNIIRPGFSNRLMTKRNGGSFPWLQWDTFMDFYMQDPEYDRDYSNLFNNVRWRPLPWMSANVDSQVPVGNGGMEFTEINSYLSFQPARNFSFSVGHFFIDDHPFFEDRSNIRLSTYTRLTDNWGIGTAHYYELDDNTLELQQYTLHRDLSSWTAAIGAQIRDNRIEDEFSLVFSLTLKAFPQVGTPVDFVGSSISSF